MSEGPPEEPPDEPPIEMPKWVPAAIGLVLVAIAGLAIYTGLTYRGPSLQRKFVKSRTVPVREEMGAPGEPQPGASRILHGEEGGNAPQPGPLENGNKSRVSITGGREGTVASIRLSARRGVQLNVTPNDTILYINNQPIGLALQFATAEEAWEFPPEAEKGGTFRVRLVAPGYDEVEYVVSASPNAPDEIAQIRVALARQK